MSSNNGKKKVHTFTIKDGATAVEILEVMKAGGNFLRESPKGTSVILNFERDGKTFMVARNQESEEERTRMAVLSQIYGTPSGKSKEAIIASPALKQQR